jgi:hypothetical protein
MPNSTLEWLTWFKDHDAVDNDWMAIKRLRAGESWDLSSAATSVHGIHALARLLRADNTARSVDPEEAKFLPDHVRGGLFCALVELSLRAEEQLNHAYKLLQKPFRGDA